MKQIYIRVLANNKFGYDIISCNEYKYYPEYDLSIIKYLDKYSVVDTKTGLRASKYFNKLKDCKSFMEHTEEQNFINWLGAVNRARTSERYNKLILRIR